MTEIERVQDQVARAFNGEAWPGVSLKAAVAGVTAQQASQRPLPNSHTIWEIVLHVAVWKDVVRRRLEWEPVEAPPEGDYPAIPDQSESAWQGALDLLETNHRKLVDVIKASGDNWQFDRIVAVGASSVYETMHGVLQHDLYHAAQINMLRSNVV